LKEGGWWGGEKRGRGGEWGGKRGKNVYKKVRGCNINCLLFEKKAFKNKQLKVKNRDNQGGSYFLVRGEIL
jgi:hypothetical protein